jgi:hypothetical protein
MPLTNFLPVNQVRNAFNNGGFDVYQRGALVTAGLAGQTIANGSSNYMLDCWYVKNSLGGAGVITCSQIAGTLDGSPKAGKVQITTAPTSAQANGTELYQVLTNKDSIPFYNQLASMSVQVKALGNVNQIGIQFYYATSEVKLTTAIGAEQVVSVNSSTFTKCSINGQALGTAMTTSGVVGVRIRVVGVSSGNTYDLNNGFVLEQAMMNLGALVMPFQRRGESYAEEERNCQRTYLLFNGGQFQTTTVGGTAHSPFTVHFPVTMRRSVSPTTAWYGTVNNASSIIANNFGVGNVANGNNVLINDLTDKTLNLSYTYSVAPASFTGAVQFVKDAAFIEISTEI